MIEACYELIVKSEELIASPFPISRLSLVERGLVIFFIIFSINYRL